MQLAAKAKQKTVSLKPLCRDLHTLATPMNNLSLHYQNDIGLSKKHTLFHTETKLEFRREAFHSFFVPKLVHDAKCRLIDTCAIGSRVGWPKAIRHCGRSFDRHTMFRMASAIVQTSTCDESTKGMQLSPPPAALITPRWSIQSPPCELAHGVLSATATMCRTHHIQQVSFANH